MRINKKIAVMLLGLSLGCLFGVKNTYATSILDSNTITDTVTEYDVDDEINKDFTIEIEEEDESSIQATSPSKARATVTENVGADNNIYPIRREISNSNSILSDDNSNKTTTTSTSTSGTTLEKRPEADARQFVTFTTKSGKVFHLIINHDNDNENVQLLTEVSEQDLLNLIEKNDNNKTKEVKKVVKKETTASTTNTNQVEKEAPKKNSNMLIYVILGLGALGAVYYFKFFKNKDKKSQISKNEDFEDNFFDGITDDKDDNLLDRDEDELKDLDIEDEKE